MPGKNPDRSKQQDHVQKQQSQVDAVHRLRAKRKPTAEEQIAERQDVEEGGPGMMKEPARVIAEQFVKELRVTDLEEDCGLVAGFDQPVTKEAAVDEQQHRSPGTRADHHACAELGFGREFARCLSGHVRCLFEQ